MAVNFNWDLPPQEYIEYLKTRGVRGKKSIEILSKGLHFVDVFNTPVGFQILVDLVMMHSTALDQICKFEATDKDKLMYEVLEELIQKWATKIKTYENEVQKAIENAKHGQAE